MNRLSLLIPSLLATMFLQTQTTIAAEPQSIEKVLAAAYSSNPTLLAARSKLQATDEGVPQALSNWRPDVALSGAYGASDVTNRHLNTSARHQSRSPKSLELSVTQPLYRGGRTVAAISGAENDVLAERARLLGVEQSVLLSAASAYMDVVRDQAVLNLTINNEQVLRRQLEAATDRFRVGEITRTDVYQAEARLAGSTADRIKAEGDLEVSRAGFRKVVDFAPGKLASPTFAVPLPSSVDDAVAIALKNSPRVLTAQYSERSSRDTVESVRGELLPTVSLSGSASRSIEGSSETSEVDAYSAKLSLSVPLYQSGSVYSRLRAARQQANQKRREIDQARRDATESARQAWETLQTSRARIDSFNAQIRAAEIALEGVKREAAVGSRTVLDVLDSEQELLDASVNLVRAKRDETVNVFSLKSALGELTARHLNLSVTYYDPKSYYRGVRGKWFGGGQ